MANLQISKGDSYCNEMQWFAAMILWKKEKIASVHVNQHIIILSNEPCPKIKRPPLRSLNIFEANNWPLVLRKQGFPTVKDSWWFRNPANHFIIIWISFIIVISKVYSSFFKKQHPFPPIFLQPQKNKKKHHPHSFPGFPLRDLAHQAQQMAHQGAFPGHRVVSCLYPPVI